MKRSDTAFEGVLQGYCEKWLEQTPTFATIYGGLRETEGKLGNLDLEFHRRREAERQKTLRALNEISPAALSNDQHLDRLALTAQILKESEDHARGRHSLEPDAPSQLFEILLHELQRGDDHPARARQNLLSLLRQAPDFLDSAAQAVRHPEPVWLRIMDQTVAGAGALLEGARQFIRGQTGRAQPKSAKTEEAAIQATEHAIARYAAHVHSLEPAPAGSFALGAGAMQRRVRDQLGLDYTLAQIESLALEEAARVGALLQKACSRFGHGKTAGEILSEHRAAWRPGKPLLQLYETETRRIADGFRRARAVTFPEGDKLVVKPVPAFLAPIIATAAYSSPGAFSKEQQGIFWVNDLGHKNLSDTDRVREEQQHFGVPLTCAHEAYPGHHLQFVFANRHPRKWRRLFSHAVFYEGWTLSCEQMMVDLKIDRSPWVPIQQLHDALWRCHRILIDLRLQTGRYSHRQAASHLQKHLHFTRARAEADVNWYTTQPAVPMSYWLGRLEMDRLKRRLIDGRGWSLQRFNDWVLSFGSLPQSWIEKYGLD